MTRAKKLKANPICEVCGIVESCHVHHIILRSQGGSDRADNLAALCHYCHLLMPDDPARFHYLRESGGRVWHWLRTGIVAGVAEALEASTDEAAIAIEQRAEERVKSAAQQGRDLLGQLQPDKLGEAGGGEQ